MRIAFGKYIIRDWVSGDARSIVRHADNRKVAMWLRDRFPSPYTAADAEAFLKLVSAQDPRTVFAVATSEEAIGGIGLEFGRDVHRFTAELGYWLGESFWGDGIATGAVRAFVPWAFETFKLHRIFAAVFDGNTPSVRVLEKAGFEREGRLHASVLKHGQILDQLLYARINKGIVRKGGR